MASFKDLIELDSLVKSDDDFEIKQITPDELELLSEPPEISYTGEQQEIRKKMATGLLRSAADITPFVGTSIAATELPEDAAMVKDLLEQGYDEGSITKMGLGAGLGVLTALGFVPAAKIATDIGKDVIKSSVAKQTQEVFQTPERLEQIEMSKKLFPSSKQSAERRRYLEEVNRPTPVVYHGSKDIGRRDIPDDAMRIDDNTYSIMSPEGATNIREINLYQNRAVETIDELRYVPTLFKRKKGTYDNGNELISYPQITLEDFNAFQQGTLQTSANMKLPTIPIYYNSYDPKYNQIETRPFYLRKGESNNTVNAYDGDSGKLIQTITVEDYYGNDSIDAETLKDFINTRTNFARMQSNNANRTIYTGGESRGDRLERDGFGAYRDYSDRYSEKRRPSRLYAEDAAGAFTSSGRHIELKVPGLSTSRDPLVSMKDSFGGFKTSNIVYMELPKSRTIDMSRSDYDKDYGVDPYSDKIFSDEKENLVGINLPKSQHLEAETALLKPEEMQVRKLDPEEKYTESQQGVTSQFEEPSPVNTEGTQSRVDRVVEGQRLANKLVKDRKDISNMLDDIFQNKRFDTKNSIASYNKIKNYFNELQMLGKYTEQYGARGTYDNFLANEVASEFRLLGELQEGLLKTGSKQKAKNIATLKALLQGIKYNPPSAVTKITDYSTKQETSSIRGVPKSLIRKALFTDADLKDFTVKERDMLEKAGIYTNPEDMRPELIGYKGLKQLLFMAADEFKDGGFVKRR